MSTVRHFLFEQVIFFLLDRMPHTQKDIKHILIMIRRVTMEVHGNSPSPRLLIFCLGSSVICSGINLRKAFIRVLEFWSDIGFI